MFIDLEPNHAFRTVKKEDRLESEDMEFHRKVYEAYIAEAEENPDRIVKIVPCQDKSETKEKILNALRQRGIIR